MNRTAWVSSLLIVVAVSAFSAAQADTASDEAAIRKLVNEVWKKVEAKKYDGLDLNADGVWQATSQGGLWQRQTRESQMALLNESPNTLRVSANHVEVTFLGSKKDAAYVVFYLSGKIELPGGHSIPNYRTRASWAMEKKDGSWVVTGAHYSPLFGGSGVRFE